MIYAMEKRPSGRLITHLYNSISRFYQILYLVTRRRQKLEASSDDRDVILSRAEPYRRDAVVTLTFRLGSAITAAQMHAAQGNMNCMPIFTTGARMVRYGLNKREKKTNKFL